MEDEGEYHTEVGQGTEPMKFHEALGNGLHLRGSLMNEWSDAYIIDFSCTHVGILVARRLFALFFLQPLALEHSPAMLSE